MKSVVICMLLSMVSIKLSAHRLNLYEVIDGDYKRVKSIQNLPKVILDGFVEKGWCTGLGEYGEAFNESDVLQQDLPCSRLISAGNKNGYWYVYYERTTRFHAHRLMIYKISNGALINSWAYASSFQNSISFKDVIESIETKHECFVSPPEYLFSRKISESCIPDLDLNKVY